GGIATVAANRPNGGNVIAGDLLIKKGVELLSGVITYINHTDGYFRLNGVSGNATLGVMVRLNDPTGRHTIQQGSGCGTGPNCSPDPRFTEDPDNYTQAFGTGYPLCLPSTAARPFTDVLDLNRNGNTAETLTAQARADGASDLLCPTDNRPPVPPGSPLLGTPVTVADSRRFAPIKMGDFLTVEGNFERVGGVWFLSAWHTAANGWLVSADRPDQPDYMTLEEAGIDAPAFFRQRIKGLFLGRTAAPNDATFTGGDVKFWSTHHDASSNQKHEFPLGSTAGCDIATGAQRCTFNEGIPNAFKIVYDVDFLRTPPAIPELDPCQHLRADPVFARLNPCPQGGTLAEDFAVLSPIPHEIIGRTGRKMVDLQRPGGPVWRTLDLNGEEAPNGQYLFPMGIGLGGIDVADLLEINLNRGDFAVSFSAIPWNLDRRLSPGGCNGPCEATPQPLTPFPFEGFDPRTQAPNTPTVAFTDPNFTASPLSNVTNRILSFVDGALGKFNGDRTVLAWPPADPPAMPVTPAAPTGN
ncbi:MAG: hypothetical protein NTZ05_18125, partial [Chloroflexi bacterium]|nr:hypothetical protein [Chloroflexota bacterium]